jgi:hypothetical protein
VGPKTGLEVVAEKIPTPVFQSVASQCTELSRLLNLMQSENNLLFLSCGALFFMFELRGYVLRGVKENWPLQALDLSQPMFARELKPAQALRESWPLCGLTFLFLFADVYVLILLLTYN